MFFWDRKKDAHKPPANKNRPTENAIEIQISENVFSKMVANNLKGKRLEQSVKNVEAKKLYKKMYP